MAEVKWMENVCYDTARFALNERPICVRDPQVLERNREFLERVDCSYFIYVADVHAAQLNGAHAQAAALSLRAAYSHGLEALFAFLGALIQAPTCAYGWLASYHTKELRSLIAKIGGGETILTRFKTKVLDWDHISSAICENLVLSDVERTAKIKHSYALLWKRLASDFLDKGFQDEYNSIKHGFRAKAGGFSMAIGPYQAGGVPCPPEKMHSLGGSNYGSSYFILERLADANAMNFRSRRRARNWSPVNFGNALHLVAMSLNNIVGKLRILSGEDPTKIQYQYPEDLESCEAPWREVPGVIECSFDYDVDSSLLPLLNRDQILSVYASPQPRAQG